METNLRERSTRYQCVIRPKVHFAPDFSRTMKLFSSIADVQPKTNFVALFFLLSMKESVLYNHYTNKGDLI